MPVTLEEQAQPPGRGRRWLLVLILLAILAPACVAGLAARETGVRLGNYRLFLARSHDWRLRSGFFHNRLGKPDGRPNDRWIAHWFTAAGVLARLDIRNRP